MTAEKNKYKTIREILDYCESNNINNFANLVNWCRINNWKWFKAICDETEENHPIIDYFESKLGNI
ncbi:MAG: hypothetical protein HFH80_05070 [Lachnospiraceae bacterium]|nr:hypothetical protein [Lachnospiraceae bacterium]